MKTNTHDSFVKVKEKHSRVLFDFGNQGGLHKRVNILAGSWKIEFWRRPERGISNHANIYRIKDMEELDMLGHVTEW